MTTLTNEVLLTCITYMFLSTSLFGSGGLCASVPGIYILGDSLVDVGNNNYLPFSVLKGNYPHNGMDFPTGQATGCFSIGKIAADFISKKVGLPLAQPFLSLQSEGKKLASTSATITGVSFASGGSRILDETNKMFQKITLTQQLDYFSIVHDQLVQRLGSNVTRTHLAKSLFLIVFGSNDLSAYYNKDSQVQSQYTAQQYVDLMISTLKQRMKRLYGLGARKFVVIGVPVIVESRSE